MLRSCNNHCPGTFWCPLQLIWLAFCFSENMSGLVMALSSLAVGQYDYHHGHRHYQHHPPPALGAQAAISGRHFSAATSIFQSPWLSAGCRSLSLAPPSCSKPLSSWWWCWWWWPCFSTLASFGMTTFWLWFFAKFVLPVDAPARLPYLQVSKSFSWDSCVCPCTPPPGFHISWKWVKALLLRKSYSCVCPCICTTQDFQVSESTLALPSVCVCVFASTGILDIQVIRIDHLEQV